MTHCAQTKLKAAKLGVVVLVLTLPMSSANAQWWRIGPKNFEECVLEKMKGQAPGMVQYARKACKELFPEEELFQRGEDFDVNWCEDDATSISACLATKKNVKVLRAEAWLTKGKCEDNSGELYVKVPADPPMFGSTYKFKVADAQSYKCAVFNFFGIRKN